MRTSPSDIDEIVRGILQGAAGMDAAGPAPRRKGHEERYQAEVRYNGEWCGRVRIDLSPALARQLASAMQRLPQDDLNEALVMDAVGELANMIAGNLRPLLEGARSVGVPVVRRGPSVAAKGTAMLDRAYDCGGRSVGVELLAS